MAQTRRRRQDRTHPRLAVTVLVVLTMAAGIVAACSLPPTPAPDPAAVSSTQWRLGESGPDLLSGFRDTPYNNDGAPAPSEVDSPDLPGRRAISFTMPGGGKRTELEPSVPSIREGAEAWYGFAWYLAPDFPVDTSGWQVLAQWKNSGDGSPPIEVKVGKGQFVLDGGAGGSRPRTTYFTRPIGAATPGKRTEIVVHIRFSADSDQAIVDVWQDGQKRIGNYRPPGGTLYDGENSYLKTGIYRDSGISEAATLFLDDARIASSYDSAAALAGTAPTGG